MLLSIVMMVKNEKKILEKTLTSLNGLRSSIESELVIVDTGSDDNTIEIAKKYTDRVYFEKWDGDFSSMRNKSISYASGEWVFIIDADEVLVEYQKIVDLFSSELYKKYNSASVEIKNFYSYDKEMYGFSTIIRLFKNDNFKYIGSIHEQPLYKEPVYNKVCKFEHYGYIFEDEEFRMQKIKRNEVLLFKELGKNLDNPYINYQLGKNFIVSLKYHEALYYLERSVELYRRLNLIPGYLYTNLAKVYFYLGKYKKCENLCLKYISKEKNDIDMYFYLFQSQVGLGKYEKCIQSYKRYIYLIENYDISLQANNLFSDSETIILRDNAVIMLLKVYYKLEKYELVIKAFSDIKKQEKRKEGYFSLFMSLYKLDRFEDILKYYRELPNSLSEKNNFYNNVELVLSNIKEDEKESIYKIASKIDGNYGKLNYARLKEFISISECKNILKTEKNVIYASLIKIACKNGLDLFNMIHDFEVVWINKYINFIVADNKEFSFELYKYLIEVPNTSDIEKIKVYRILSKAILENINLNMEKYKELFYFYVMYSYQYIRYMYNNFEDEELLYYLSNDEERFIIKFKNITQSIYDDKLIYIKNLKELIYEYPENKKIVKFIIEDLEKDLNESEELKLLKVQFINNIEYLLEDGNIKEAKELMEEYSENFADDVKVLNIKGIIFMIEGNFQKADIVFKKAYSLDFTNEDSIENIKYLKNVRSNIL
ncbi:glycosyltransferase [Clostridioides sp. ES-S-0108-01]|uniref:glycosyltransferase n=1 Tax=Clostridioides sp. ES-S-0108-01 TaxID=2770773 RepID=UPI001D0C068C|nr:glycosyltransferase [Clostridioides sp. ES-S-0108-01]UDN51449.1 glycosyltransferase [Clostridioides sp. ES-S-0107-01]